jgi:leader peptidase (prepilin peptidase)/N-methyltransferase
MWAELLLALCFGLIWGSFANVVIWRWPKGQSVVFPRSRCTQCGQPIAWYDNVPVLSWLILRGCCRNCKVKISFRYPLVELMVGALFAGIYYRYGLTWLTLEYMVFAWGLVVVSFIDLDLMLLPDVFTLSGIVMGLVGAALNPQRDFMSSFYGVLMGGGFLWLVAYLYLLVRKQEGMGGGDIKLLAWIGAVLGWTAIPFVVLVSSILGSVVGLVLARRNPAGLKSVIPFGPYLAAGALLFMFGGERIGLWYIGLFLPAFSPVN